MLVKDLITILETFPKDYEVYVSQGSFTEDRPATKYVLYSDDKRLLITWNENKKEVKD